MSPLDPSRLHVTFRRGGLLPGLHNPRRYTLTHSDLTGELFLTVGMNYDRKQIAGIYTRLMRDEVLAEWKQDAGGPGLHVYCHVSGGLALGSAAWRNDILHHHMAEVIQAFRLGDNELFVERPDLEDAPVYVHFQSNRKRYRQVEDWGRLQNYRLPGTPGQTS